MAKMPGLQRHLHIDDDNTIAMRVTMPARRQQISLHIDDGDNPIVTKTAETPHIKDGNDFIMTMAKMPATINVLTMVLVVQPNSQDACGIGSHAFAALGWVEG